MDPTIFCFLQKCHLYALIKKNGKNKKIRRFELAAKFCFIEIRKYTIILVATYVYLWYTKRFRNQNSPKHSLNRFCHKFLLIFFSRKMALQAVDEDPLTSDDNLLADDLQDNSEDMNMAKDSNCYMRETVISLHR